jgi:hypothetical protein
MAVTSLRIVKSGTITIDGFESFSPQNLAMKQFCGIGGGSTVTYLESDVKILVDTGFEFENNLGEFISRQTGKSSSTPWRWPE